MRSIPSPNYGGTRGKVLWIIVHTAEGATSVDGLGAFFANPAAQVSSHVGIDDHETVAYVDYAQTAWTARSANPVSDQAELCAFAAWTRTEWLQHSGMLENTAQWIADRCRTRGIPPVKLTPAQVAARQPGVIGHVDITLGLRDGTHTDPGPNFPWDTVMARVQQILNPPQEDDMPPYNSWPAADKAQLCQDVAAAIANRAVAGTPGGPDEVALWLALNQVHSKVVRETYDLSGRPADRRDDLLGHVLSTEARVKALADAPQISGGSPVGVDVAQLAKAVADELDRRARDNNPATGPTS